MDATNKRVMPTLLVTNPKFVYRNAASTDVRDTWKKYGWRSVEEERKIEQQTKQVQ